MIEYLYNGIRAHAGNDLTISAIVTNEAGEEITENITLVLHDKDRETMIYSVVGTYSEEAKEMTFVIPREITKGKSGRYWYCITHEGNALCFKEPIYLV